MATLIEALRMAGDPPCEKYKCPKAEHCAQKAVACESFVFYVNNGRAFPPNYTYGVSTTNRMTVRGASQTVKPTKRIYKRMNSDC